MPVYNPTRVEYAIVNGRVSIVADDGTVVPGYWSHPDLGGVFPAICLVHDWWGITPNDRRIAHLFAQLGYYVLMPDLFDGATAVDAYEAAELIRRFGSHAYTVVDRALKVLEKHNRTNGSVGVVGFGMGGSLVYEAALMRTDLEAAVAFYGLPGRYFGKFKGAHAPILAFYGAKEVVVKPDEIARLRAELAESLLPHEVVILPNTARDLFRNGVSGDAAAPDVMAWEKMLAFLDKHVLRHDAHREKK